MRVNGTDKKYIFTVSELEELLQTEESVVLYGAGDYGKEIANYIISIGKKTKIAGFLVTEKSPEITYKGIRIWKLKEEWNIKFQDCLILITVSLPNLPEVVEIVQKYKKRYLCITPELYNNIKRKKKTNCKQEQSALFKGWDFLAAGFSKCGTTSLYQVLRQIDDIYLPETKECELFGWCDRIENPKERLVETYFNDIRKNQIVGMIEPTFINYAERIPDFFGRQIKIIFCVRNPVDAVFSVFKMYGRGSCAGELVKPYKKFGGKCSMEVFEYWFAQRTKQNCPDLYHYAEWIGQFLKYYPKRQIKVIVFEELIQSPRDTVNDILQFIGSSGEYMLEELPHINEGKFVMADLNGLEIAERRGRLEAIYRYPDGVLGQSRDTIYEEYLEVKGRFRQAEKIYDLTLSGEMRKKLERYYYDSVRELEGMLNKDLSEIWF